MLITTGDGLKHLIYGDAESQRMVVGRDNGPGRDVYLHFIGSIDEGTVPYAYQLMSRGLSNGDDDSEDFTGLVVENPIIAPRNHLVAVVGFQFFDADAPFDERVLEHITASYTSKEPVKRIDFGFTKLKNSV